MYLVENRAVFAGEIHLLANFDDLLASFGEILAGLHLKYWRTSLKYWPRPYLREYVEAIIIVVMANERLKRDFHLGKLILVKGN